MARKQTRKSVSFAKPIYDAIVAEAARRKLPASHFVELLVRKAIKGLPATHHMAIGDVAKAQRGRDLRARRVVPAATVPLPPSMQELAALRRECDRRVGNSRGRGTSQAESQSRERAVSRIFVAELRKRNWISAEGYAPGNWSNEQ